MAAALRTSLLLLALASCTPKTAAPLLPDDLPGSGEILLHAGPLQAGQVVRAAIVSQSYPVAMAAAEVRGATSGVADAVVYDAFTGSGDRVLVVSGDFGRGPVIIDTTPLSLSVNHALAEVWVRVRPNGFVDVSWQLLYGEPAVSLTANGGTVTIENRSDRPFKGVHRAALFGGNTIRVCPFEVELPSGARATLEPKSYCVTGESSGKLPLVLSRIDGSQAIVVGDVRLNASSGPVLPTTRIAELETRLGADGALLLRAPDGSSGCACEGTVFGREQVKLVRAERECVLVEYPDKTQRCLEAAAPP